MSDYVSIVPTVQDCTVFDRPPRLWKLPLSIALCVASLALLVSTSDDLLELILFVALTLTLTCFLLLFAFLSKLRQGGWIAVTLVIYLALSWEFTFHFYQVRTEFRWPLEKNAYKAQVMAQPTPAAGQLKHVEWAGWGFAGEDTVVYLVFDPGDKLAAELRSHSFGRFSGVPCDVYNVHRLESHWYTVWFYTDTDWDYCTY